MSFLVAGLFLHRQRDIKRMFSYSSIEHMGLMTFAFGLGGPLATFGALLHMLVHSLTKSAIFVTVGHAAHIAGTQRIDHIRGLIRTQPAVGWSLADRRGGHRGLPALRRLHQRVPAAHGDHEGGALADGGRCSAAWRSPSPACSGICTRWSTARRPRGSSRSRANMFPVAIHLALVLWLGLAIPGFLAQLAGSGDRADHGESSPMSRFDWLSEFLARLEDEHILARSGSAAAPRSGAPADAGCRGLG